MHIVITNVHVGLRGLDFLLTGGPSTLMRLSIDVAQGEEGAMLRLKDMSTV